MNNGQEHDYFLTDNDTFAFEGEETLVITSEGNTYQLAVNDIRKIVFVDTVDTQELDASTPFFYPNPVKSNIIIGNVNDNQPVRIYALDGRLVSQFTVSAQKSVDLSNLPSGMYIINFSEKNLKLLKQ